MCGLFVSISEYIFHPLAVVGRRNQKNENNIDIFYQNVVKLNLNLTYWRYVLPTKKQLFNVH